MLLGAAAPSPTVTVSVTHLRSDKGVVRACMTTDAARFPKCAGDPQSHRAIVPASEGGVTLTFKGVTPGRYAIALLHDENANGKADRAMGMMPREGFGFSRDAPVRMAPPAFADAAFPVSNEDLSLTIRMRYIL
ncbi:DUF2141 domain-containing protein [Tsuneonella sp. SYSU-LHT278]|uniref:DUF2141 domain-containing protein n=1 Tax=Tsuneonella sediminis TaxID=3416089 RepID=UPI003F7A5FD5